MSDEVTRQLAEASADRKVAREQYDWMKCERDDWQKRAETAERERTESLAEALQLRREYQAERAEVEATREERDAARADLAKERDAAESEIAALRHQRDAARAEVAIVIEERDAWQQRADALAKSLESAAQRVTAEIHRLTAERDVALAEAEGLRADQVAHPPETHTELAAERKRHVELMEDYGRQAATIGILEDAVKRAENALATAQAKRVDPRIPGYLAAIAQLASQIEEMLP